MGRVCVGRLCYGPSLQWAEFAMGRDVQLPSIRITWTKQNRIGYHGGTTAEYGIALRFLLPILQFSWFLLRTASKKSVFNHFQGLFLIIKEIFSKFKDNSRTNCTFLEFKEFSRTKVIFKDFSRSVRTLSYAQPGPIWWLGPLQSNLVIKLVVVLFG